MPMMFSECSDVTVVITCCGRLDLLQETLCSFFENNTYPIKEIIIIEDSGDNNVRSVVPREYKQHVTLLINNEKLGQIRSIDKAYALINTDYIFHCEEDWVFYRKGFIEDSKAILNNNDHIYQVWLRSFYHDVHQNYPFHTLGEDVSAGGTTAYRLLSSNPKWQGFSFNPGLRRLADYRAIPGGYSSFLDEKESASSVESGISKYVCDNNRFAALLENDAVAYSGLP